MSALRVSRALLLCWAGFVVGCSTVPPEEGTLGSSAESLVEGWQAAGSMADTRKLHAGVVLPSGKVLVVGGGKGSTSLASATVYDPGTGNWTLVAPMAEGRQSHTATVLPSGKVLVAGGDKSGSGLLASALVYDPATNTWASAGSFASGMARKAPTATLLTTGKVLVVGGDNNGPRNTVDVYDPGTGTWSLGPNLGAARRNHTATRLASGKVLVVGGVGNSTPSVLATAEVYDPASNTWTATGALTTARYDHTATLLPSGKVLVVGGRINSSSLTATAEEYDPATGTWSAAGALASAREQHTATLLGTGKVLVAGGLNGNSLASAEVYDPAARQWSATASMATARHAHVAVALEAQGKVLVVGGLLSSASGTAGVATAEAYVHDACSSVSCNSPPGPCYQAAGTCSNGVCSYAPKAAGSACDDGNACTGGDTCNGAGACTGGAISCSSPPGQCYQPAGTCSNGSCSYAYKPSGTACNDGDACTVGEVCNGAGGCAGTPVTCNSPPSQCHQAAGTCSSGKCTYAFKPAGSSCNDGNDATINDTCDGGGGCFGQYQCNESNYYCPAPPPTYGAWSACSYGNACASTGTQSRTVTPYTASYSCFYAQCFTYQGTTYAETQTCSRPQPTLQCPGASYGAWSACGNTDNCGYGGTQSRTVTTYSADYNSCQCVASTYTETQECTLPTSYPYMVCNGACTDVSFDSTNCGRCGNKCITPKFVCSDGFCEQQF